MTDYKKNAELVIGLDSEEVGKVTLLTLLAIADQIAIANQLKAIELVEGDLGMQEAYMKAVLKGKSGL